MKKVNFMVTAFRDGFQSVLGARVFTKDFMPAVEAAREAGITHYEAGGGARFQTLYFYSNEDAFEMMDEFRRVAGPDADLQTLSRGVNVVGLDSQPRDIIKLHAQLFKKHGISTIRNFDALNDVNNLIDSGQAIVDAGLRHEVVVTMMALPPGLTGAHDPDFYEATLRKIMDAGIKYDSVAFKDASGTTTPAVVHETIKRARKLLGKDMNIVFHSHDTAGICIPQYISALEAGANQVDLSMAPVSGGTCQPDILTMWHALRGTEFDLGIDIKKVREAESVFQDVMKDYILPPEAMTVSPEIIFSPLPGGALTTNTQMLRDNNMMDKFPEIVEAMSETVAKGGFGTSVTPVSQFYFQQAFNNVMFGPWKRIADGYGKMVLGYFGKTPVEPDKKVVKACAEALGLEPTTEKVVDINDKDPSKGVEAAKAMLKKENLPTTDENIFITATCKEKGILYLTGKAQVNGMYKYDREAEAAKAKGEYTVTVNGKAYGVKLGKDSATVNGVTYPVAVDFGINEGAIAESAAAAPVAATAVASSGKAATVEAPMPGLVLRIDVKEGQRVKQNELLMVMEAMKMENEVYAPADGVITKISVSPGQQLQTGDELMIIGTSEGAAAAPAAKTTPAAKAAPAATAAPAVKAAPVAEAPVASSGKGTTVEAPMPGLVLRIDVKVGQSVKKNELLMVMEAMKMENEIYAPAEGVVTKISVSPGQQLQTGDELMIIG